MASNWLSCVDAENHVAPYRGRHFWSKSCLKASTILRLPAPCSLLRLSSPRISMMVDNGFSLLSRERVLSACVLVAISWMSTLKFGGWGMGRGRCWKNSFSMGRRWSGFENGGNYSHLTESERCESFPRFHNLSIKQKSIFWDLELRSWMKHPGPLQRGPD